MYAPKLCIFEVSNVELLLFVASECPKCQFVKEKLAQEIEKGTFKLVDISTPEGNARSEEMDVSAVPHLVVLVDDEQPPVVVHGSVLLKEQ